MKIKKYRIEFDIMIGNQRERSGSLGITTGKPMTLINAVNFVIKNENIHGDEKVIVRSIKVQKEVKNNVWKEIF